MFISVSSDFIKRIKAAKIPVAVLAGVAGLLFFLFGVRELTKYLQQLGDIIKSYEYVPVIQDWKQGNFCIEGSQKLPPMTFWLEKGKSDVDDSDQILVTKMAKTATNISSLSPRHFWTTATNISVTEKLCY